MTQYYRNNNTSTCYIPSNLVSVVVTDETRIGYGAFYGCEDLRSVTIEDGVTTIGTSAFYGCSRLEDVSLPETLSSVGSYAFQGCKSLSAETLASFPSSLKTVGSYAFSGCETAIGEIVIPEGVEVIGDYAFQNCYNVTNITLSSTVTNIGQCAFLDCRSITSLTIPDRAVHWPRGVRRVRVAGVADDTVRGDAARQRRDVRGVVRVYVRQQLVGGEQTGAAAIW